MKRDNGSNLNHQAVNELLSEYMVLPLNSPTYYPQYNGGIENSQSIIKSALMESDYGSLRELRRSGRGHDRDHQDGYMQHLHH